MKLLFIADIYGRPGRRAICRLLPSLFDQYNVDICIANGENAAGGFGITEKIAEELFSYGINVLTSGNHIWDKKEVLPYLERSEYLLRPANYPPTVVGKGAIIFQTPSGIPVGVLNLQGRTYIRELDCPFRVGDKEIARLRQQTNVIVVDFHAEATSEKIAMGWYLDGRVSAAVGTHTHVQTCDETILPQGTAYITDVGMTGPHDSVIGVRKKAAIDRFLTQIPLKFESAKGDVKLCAVVVDVDEQSGKANNIQRLRIDL